jgi:hypothetical protein
MSSRLERYREANLERQIAELHAELKLQRHPPSPTEEWMMIQKLVDTDLLDPNVHEHLR